MAYIGAGLSRFNTADTLTVSGDANITGTVNPSGDTASGDAAAVGFTSTEGLILTGQGSTSDITLKNDADAVVFSVPTGTDDILFPDNAKALFGAGSDISVSWDGTDGHITTLGTLNIDGADGHEMATFVDGGAVTLFHNDSAKLATTSGGVDVTGDFNASGHVKSEGADGGMIMRSWTNNASYASLATNGMTGTEYILINNGETTYLGSGASGSTVIRGPSNSAAAQITVGASQTDVAGPLYVAGKLGLDSTDYIQWTNNTRLDFYVNNSNEFRMESDGDFHADGDVVAFSTTIASDPRLKENVEPVTDALSKIERLTGYTFDYKHGGSSAGVMSTDVAQVLPSAVSKKALPLKTGDEETEYDVVAYDQLHALLIEAVKELSVRVTELENGASK